MMTIKTENWLGEFVSTIGTGDAILGGAIDGFAGFSNVGDDVDVYYTIIDGLDKETGIGTLTGGKLVRKDIHATLVDGAYVKNGSAINLSGNAQVYGTANAHFLDYVQAVSNAEIVNTQAIAELKSLQINGHALTASFNLTAADVRAHPDSWMPSTEALNVYQKDASDIRYIKTQDAEQVAGLVMRVGGAREQQLQQSINDVSTAFIGDAPPAGAPVGKRWFDTESGRTYIKYNDGDSTQWIEESPQGLSPDGLESRIDEALRRSYAEAGYNLVDGSFEAGGTLANANDVMLHEATGKGFTGPVGPVAAGTNPASGGFVDRSSALLRTVVDKNKHQLNLGGVPFSSAVPKSSFLFGSGGVAIIGDSISHGAFSRNIFRNNWTSIFKRAWNVDNQSENYGFVSLYGPLGTDGLLSKDIVDVSRSGFSSIQGVSAAESPSGHMLQSVVADAYIEVTSPSINGILRVCWIGQSGGGSFDVFRNGVLLSTVDTSTLNGFAATQFNVNDNGRGKVAFKFVTKSAAPVIICGVMYSNSDSRNSVHNFSQSGRRLANASTAALTSAISGASTLIMALGHNDSSSSSDAAYMVTFNEKIDLIISLCKSRAIPVIVPDFCWRSPTTDPVRVALKRLADETNGVYLPFPEWFKSDGSRFANTDQQTTTYKLFDDGSHPNINGHKIIGAAVCKAAGLQHSCRDILLKYHDWWFPVAIPSSSALINYNSNYNEILRAKRNGDLITLTGWLKNSSGGNVPVGEHVIADTTAVSELGFTNTTQLFLPAFFAEDSFVGHVRVKYAQLGISYKMSLDTFASVTLNNTLSVDFTY